MHSDSKSSFPGRLLGFVQLEVSPGMFPLPKGRYAPQHHQVASGNQTLPVSPLLGLETTHYFKSAETSSGRDLRSENSGQASQLLKKLMKTIDQSPGRCPSMYTQYCHTTSEQPWTPLPPPLPPNTTMEAVEFLAVHPRSPCPDLGHLPHCLDDK